MIDFMDENELFDYEPSHFHSFIMITLPIYTIACFLYEKIYKKLRVK